MHSLSFSLRDGDITGYAWPRPGAPRLMFLHANGFNARTYRSMLQPLAEHFDILALDLRGHGRCRLPTPRDRMRNYDIYVEDIEAVITQLDRPVDILSGHSLGATVSLLTTHRLQLDVQLALIEAVILPAPIYYLNMTPLQRLMHDRLPFARLARRRGRSWADTDTVRARYARRKPFSLWAPGVLDDYLADGLRPAPDGVELTCPPEWEAANYEAQGHNVPHALAKTVQRLGSRFTLLRAEFESTLMDLSAIKRHGLTPIALDGLTHLAPQEAPERVASELIRVLG